MIEIYVNIPSTLGLTTNVEWQNAFQLWQDSFVVWENSFGEQEINGRLDTSDNVTALITRSIADIREPQSRSSEWSKTIEIPGTKKNNMIFSHLFEVEQNITSSVQYTPDFNPNLKANVILYSDGIEQLRGFLRLLAIKVDDSTHITYEVSLHGQTADLFTSLAESKLNALRFSEYNHTLSSGAVINSWATSITKNGSSQAFSYGDGYVYAMFDKGYSNIRNITQYEVAWMTPCLYAKTIVDKMFSNNGYTYTNDSFFNSDRFKRLVIPPPNGLTVNADVLEERRYRATRTTTQSLSIGTPLIFNNDSTSGNFDNGNNYNTSTGAYVVPVGGDYVFDLTLDIVCNMGAYMPLYLPSEFTIAIGMYVNNLLVKTTTFQQTFGAPTTQDIHLTLSQAKIGDSVTFKLSQVYDSLNNTTLVNSQFSLDILANSSVENDCHAFTFGYGETVDFSVFLNSEVKQSEMLLSFVKMFNLYIEADKDNPKMLRCVPRDEFYNGAQVDWTYKLDYSQPVEIVPMGELDANPYKFSYKEAQDDENKYYQEKYQSTYGSRTYEIDNQFIKTEKKIDIVFSPTQVKSYDNAQKNFVLSSIESQKDGDLRIFYYAGLQSGVSWRLYAFFNLMNVGYSNQTSLPLTLHYDSLSNPTYDILFGMPKEIGVGAGYKYTNSNLVNNYYYKFLTEITSKNSKLLRAYFRITPADYFTLRFSDAFFFENQYWRLNKIEDYNPVADGVYMCEFLLSQFVAPTPKTQKTIGAGTAQGREGDINGDIFPSGSNPIKPGIKGVNVGGAQTTGNGVFVGQNISQSSEASNNSGLGSIDTIFPNGTNGSVALVCNDFEVTKSDTMYVGNYEMYPNFLSGGAVQTITSNYNATKDDWLILASTTMGNITITLPDPTGLSGKTWIIKKPLSGHQVIIDTATSAQIDGTDSHTQTTHHSYDVITTDGVEFYIIGEGH